MEKRKKKHEADKGKKHKQAPAKVPRALCRLRLDSDSDISEAEQIALDGESDCPESQEPESESTNEDHFSQPGPSNDGPSESTCPHRHGVLPARFRDDVSDA